MTDLTLRAEHIENDFADAMYAIFKQEKYGIKSCKDGLCSTGDKDTLLELMQWQQQLKVDLSCITNITLMTKYPVEINHPDPQEIGGVTGSCKVNVKVKFPEDDSDLITIDQDGCFTTINIQPKCDGGGGPTPTNLAYVHTQTTSSATWVINHNLGYQPNFFCVDDAGNQLSATVVYASLTPTGMTLQFSSPFTGKAFLS